MIGRFRSNGMGPSSAGFLWLLKRSGMKLASRLYGWFEMGGFTEFPSRLVRFREDAAKYGLDSREGSRSLSKVQNRSKTVPLYAS